MSHFWRMRLEWVQSLSEVIAVLYDHNTAVVAFVLCKRVDPVALHYRVGF